MRKATGKSDKFVLTAEQREIAEQIRRQVEAEKPEILAEGRRVEAAAQAMSAHLQGTMHMVPQKANSARVALLCSTVVV